MLVLSYLSLDKVFLYEEENKGSTNTFIKSLIFIYEGLIIKLTLTQKKNIILRVILVFYAFVVFMIWKVHIRHKNKKLP